MKIFYGLLIVGLIIFIMSVAGEVLLAIIEFLINNFLIAFLMFGAILLFFGSSKNNFSRLVMVLNEATILG